ncbi:hypothetical protein NP493_704g01037 [Ridgeia piscesae]|uniref:Uncharacterized protein n=1 Tax=Ridgeia piscesae TaxID=27915 RepID=A0AAD9KQJ3_RIDPI|nr:hypothetical protein NP493_704g01037 [Ridgeia piscesae]
MTIKFSLYACFKPSVPQLTIPFMHTSTTTYSKHTSPPPTPSTPPSTPTTTYSKHTSTTAYSKHTSTTAYSEHTSTTADTKFLPPPTTSMPPPSTTAFCIQTDGMDDSTIISKTQVDVTDKAAKGSFKPSAKTPLTTYENEVNVTITLRNSHFPTTPQLGKFDLLEHESTNVGSYEVYYKKPSETHSRRSIQIPL